MSGQTERSVTYSETLRLDKQGQPDTRCGAGETQDHRAEPKRPVGKGHTVQFQTLRERSGIGKSTGKGGRPGTARGWGRREADSARTGAGFSLRGGNVLELVVTVTQLGSSLTATERPTEERGRSCG